MVGEQTSWIQSSTLRTEIRNLKIPDGEDVDVLRRLFSIQFSKSNNIDARSVYLLDFIDKILCAARTIFAEVFNQLES